MAENVCSPTLNCGMKFFQQEGKKDEAWLAALGV